MMKLAYNQSLIPQIAYCKRKTYFTTERSGKWSNLTLCVHWWDGNMKYTALTMKHSCQKKFNMIDSSQTLVNGHTGDKRTN